MICSRQAARAAAKANVSALPVPRGVTAVRPAFSRGSRCQAVKPICSTLDRPTPGGGNSSVIDKPSTETSVNWDMSFLKKRPPTYKVMLHNDSFNRRDHVVKVLMKVVSGMTVEHAMGIMQEAHENGLAVVIACHQDEAEDYCEQLRLNGLKSTIEF